MRKSQIHQLLTILKPIKESRHTLIVEIAGWSAGEYVQIACYFEGAKRMIGLALTH
jgi:hypothetical protein